MTKRQMTRTVFALAIAAAAVGGCGSARVTSAVSRAQLEVLEECRGRGADRARCVVLKTRFGGDNRLHLAHALEQTQLFREVVIGDHPGVEDWSAEILALEVPTGGLPFWTLVTLGIVPTMKDERKGYRLRLLNGQRGRDRVVDAFVDTTTVFGWLGIPLNLLPNWWVTPIRARTAYQNAFAAPLAEHICTDGHGP